MTRTLLIICLALAGHSPFAQTSVQQADSLSALLKAHPQEDTLRVKMLIDLTRAVIYNAPDDAMRYSEEMLHISEKVKWASGIAYGYRFKGLVYYIQGSYLHALEYLQKALKTADSLHNRRFESSMFNNIAIVYFELKEYSRALPYYEKYLSSSRGLGLKDEEAKALLNIGNLYGETNENDKALPYFQQSLEISEKNNYTLITGTTLNSLAILYKRKKDYPAATAAFQKSIALSRETGNLFNVATALNGLSEVYMAQGDHVHAARTAQDALAVSQQVHALKWESDAWFNLSRIYTDRHNYPQALDAYQHYVAVHDSLMNDEKKQEFTRKDLQYEFEKKETLLKADNEKKQALAAAEISRQRVVRNAVAGGAAVLIAATLLSLLFYTRRRDAQFRARVSDTEMKALRAQMNPHFIFNSLNSISDYISRNETQTATDYLVKFAGIMRTILEQSEQKEIRLSEDLKALEQYMQLEGLRLRNTFSYQIRVDPDIDPENTLVPPMILQPFVENSIWHGLARKKGEGKILIHISKEGDMIKYAVEDDGIGRLAAGQAEQGAEMKKSLGMKITGERIAILNQTRKTNASIRLSDLEQGTRVEVLLPLELVF
jgi:tetratricopeptide (TPR) repeat protein